MIIEGTHPWSVVTQTFRNVIISTERYIHCTSYAGAAGMLLHINGKFTMGKWQSSLL